MIQLIDKSKCMLSQFYLVDPLNEQPIGLYERKEKANVTVLKELEPLIRE